MQITCWGACECVCVCAHVHVCEIGKLVKNYTCLPLQCLPLNVPWQHSYSTCHPSATKPSPSPDSCVSCIHSENFSYPRPLPCMQSNQLKDWSLLQATPLSLQAPLAPRLPGSWSPASWVHHQVPAADSQRGPLTC